MQLLKFSFLASLLAVTFVFGTVPPPKNQPIPEHLRASIKRIQQDYGQGYWAERFRMKRDGKSLGLMKQSAAAMETTNVPVIFGTYSATSSKISTAKFQQLLFDGPNPTGTMTDFYLENSYNQLYMTGKCLGWYTAPRTFDYYVHDGGDRNAGLMYGGTDFTIDVFVLADDTVDFSKYVSYVDAEGAHVPYVGVVHTGGDAASGADNIWSHRWNVRWRLNQRKTDVSESIINPDNVTAAGRYITNDTYEGLPVIFDGDYAIQPELSGNNNSGTNPKAIGVFTHEFGHIFGLPDLYDTDGTSEGLGGWCLMAAGSYGGDQNHEEVPAHMSAWCKEKLGWVTPMIVSTHLPNQKIRYAEKYPDVMKLYVKGVAGGQYFLIENRQKKGFDTYLMNAGLLIFHVDPTKTNNRDESRYMVDLEQADGLRGLNISSNRGDAGDPFPGTSNNRNFDEASKPNSDAYVNLASYVGVRNISDPDTNMYADLDVGTRPYIQLLGAAFEEGSGGNSNGRIDAGETGSIRLKMKNIYPVSTAEAKVKISTTVEDITIDTTAEQFGIAGLYSLDSTFSVNVAADPSAIARIIPVTVNITTPQGDFQKTFEVLLGYPAMVLVDLDTVTTFENIGLEYRKLLDKTGKFYEIVSTRENSLSFMQLPARSIVVIVSGRKRSDIITDSLAQLLITYQNNGGNIFISGQNVLEDMWKRNSPYTADLLHATWTKNIAFGKNLIGIPTDPLGYLIPKLSLAGGDAIPNQTSPDQFDADTLAVSPMFRWNTTSGTNYGGLWWEHPTSGGKTVFWSFGLEGANDSIAGVSYKSVAITKVLDWMNGITSTPDIDAAVPMSMALFNNYPNPFNPATTITYAVPSDRSVSLVVYDMLGRQVRTLVNEKQSAGTHSIAFDASNLSSGIYLYTLRSGNFSQTKKMMVLK